MDLAPFIEGDDDIYTICRSIVGALLNSAYSVSDSNYSTAKNHSQKYHHDKSSWKAHIRKPATTAMLK